MELKPEVEEELCSQFLHEKSPPHKDIIVIVHDQLEYAKRCFESVYANTNNFTLYVWDNDSMVPTRKYLEDFRNTHPNVVLMRVKSNIGFIQPNNFLARKGVSPYIILLNSDTEVRPGWDTALTGWLDAHPNCKIVGYEGGLLEANGQGSQRFNFGRHIDYVSGWCLCLSRETYDAHGLFDSRLQFAYGEDSDLSLRMKELGHEVYAIHLPLVHHHGNVTTKQVVQEMDTSDSFRRNHEYIRDRWAKYLAERRVML